MDLSKRTDYALRMLAALVVADDGVVSVRTISRDKGVPYSFARSIQHDLAAAGLVVNSRGANGGMRLAVDPDETTLLQVVEAVQGQIELSSCAHCDADGRPCANRDTCPYTAVWCNAARMLRAMYESVTLSQLVVERVSPVMEGSFVLVGEDEARHRCAEPDASAEA